MPVEFQSDTIIATSNHAASPRMGRDVSLYPLMVNQYVKSKTLNTWE